jgi:oligoribonuclease
MKKLLWLDIETTGLDPVLGEILEIGMVVTDLDLGPIDSISVVINHPLERIKALCNEFVTKMHTDNGLFNDVEGSLNSEIYTELILMSFVEKHFPDNAPELHGNTVHFDKKWLERKMPTLAKLFNYRIVDVSSLKIMFKNYAPDQAEDIQAYLKAISKIKSLTEHRVIPDILHSIAEYHEHLTHLKLLAWKG